MEGESEWKGLQVFPRQEVCVKEALMARVARVNHGEGHRNCRAAPPSLWTPVFPTHQNLTLSTWRGVAFLWWIQNPSVFYHPLCTMKTHLLCTVSHWDFPQLSAPFRESNKPSRIKLTWVITSFCWWQRNQSLLSWLMSVMKGWGEGWTWRRPFILRESFLGSQNTLCW